MRMLLMLLATSALCAQEPRRGAPPGPGLVEPSAGARIAWYGTLGQAREEARRSGRPILLLSAAPHCHDVPGIW